MKRLVDMAWPEVPHGSVLAVAVGSCEQHGPHLPMDTDQRIATHLVEALATHDDRIVIGPPITIGASGEHESFPGTLSIGTLALEAVVVELVRSALPSPELDRPAPFQSVVLVNGHGGNIEALGRAQSLLVSEGRQVLIWHPQVPGGDSHAGRTETSMLLHLDPGCVRVDRLEPGTTARWREIGPIVLAQGLAAVTANGVLGDPGAATADEGAQVFAALVDDLVGVVRERFGAG